MTVYSLRCRVEHCSQKHNNTRVSCLIAEAGASGDLTDATDVRYAALQRAALDEKYACLTAPLMSTLVI